MAYKYKVGQQVRVISLEKFNRIFPNVNPNLDMTYSDCGIACGWSHNMAKWFGKNVKIEKCHKQVKTEKSVYDIIGNGFTWDERLLEPLNTNIKKLNKKKGEN